MTEYTLEIVQSEILNDSLLNITLGELCTDPDKAEDFDILAVEFPYRRTGKSHESNTRYEAEMPSRVLTKHNGMHFLMPWYVLETGLNLKPGQVSMIATCFSRMSHHHSLAVFDHLQDMGHPKNASLLLAHGGGGLFAEPDKDDTGLEEGDILDDEEMQRHIWNQAAVVLPRLSSNHAQVAAAPGLGRANQIVDAYLAIYDPRTVEKLKPRAAF